MAVAPRAVTSRAAAPRQDAHPSVGGCPSADAGRERQDAADIGPGLDAGADRVVAAGRAPAATDADRPSADADRASLGRADEPHRRDPPDVADDRARLDAPTGQGRRRRKMPVSPVAALADERPGAGPDAEWASATAAASWPEASFRCGGATSAARCGRSSPALPVPAAQGPQLPRLAFQLRPALPEQAPPRVPRPELRRPQARVRLVPAPPVVQQPVPVQRLVLVRRHAALRARAPQPAPGARRQEQAPRAPLPPRLAFRSVPARDGP